MEKRLLVFLLLTIAWLFMWQSFFGPSAEREPAAPAVPSAATGELANASPTPPSAPAQADLLAEREAVLELRRGNFAARFSNRGGVLSALRVKGFGTKTGLTQEQLADPLYWSALVQEEGPLASGLRWSALRDPRLLEDRAAPGLELATFLPEQALWQHEWLAAPESGGAPLPAEHDPALRAGIRFRVRLAGIELTKDIRLPSDPARYDLEVVLRASGRAPNGELYTVFAPASGLFTNEDSFYPDPVACRIVEEEGEFTVDDSRMASGSAQGPEWFEGIGAEQRLAAFGIFNKHFALLASPGSETLGSGALAQTGFESYATRTAGAEQRRLQRGGSAHWGFASLCLLRLKLDGTKTLELPFRLYAGPKSPAVFDARPEYKAYGAIVDEFDFGGWFYSIFFAGPVAHVLLWFLELFGGVLGNYGLAIILLTFLVRTLLFPINRIQQVKMAAYGEQMKRIQPELARLKEQYKDDPRQFSQKQLELMRKHGVTVPLGGCLPIFLQMPIFIGLFAALRSTILLRHEPFYLWIHDLSRPDALLSWEPVTLLFFTLEGLNLLPILMVVLWVLHQRMMPRPASMDPQQETMMKMMTFMPILFGFLLYSYASGLALYMITSSLLGIFEVRYIKKKWPIEEQVKKYQEKLALRRAKMLELRKRIEEAQKKNRRKGLPG
ncbi:MAG: membrane protein insertase YidC [Planctomycetes bacterium]|nr:membrane protein insertase YidC [Planctomycetota bacterium]